MTKNKVGRPSKFRTINQEQLKFLCLKGFTDKEISDFFDINEETLNAYKNKYPEFSKSLKDWKAKADHKVEKCLYERAIGYHVDEVTYEQSKTGGLGLMMDEGEIEGMKHTPTFKTKVVVKEIPPDVTAQIFWLKNRKPQDWREKQEGGINLSLNFSVQGLIESITRTEKENTRTVEAVAHSQTL